MEIPYFYINGVRKFIVAAVLLASVGIPDCYSQDGYKFRTLSPKGGFYYDGVNGIRQDRDGFIWVVMDNEVQRFDGYTYKRYYPKFKELLPSAQWQFNHIATDTEGSLYISTNNGIFVYNRLSDSFDRLTDISVSFLDIDGCDNIWAAMSSQQIYRIDKTTFSIDTVMCLGRPVNSVFSSYPAKDGFYMGSAYGRIYKYIYDTKDFRLVYTFPSGHSVNALASDNETLWALTSTKGLYALDEKSGRVKAVYDFHLHYRGMPMPARDMLIDKSGKLWIATQAGIWIFDPETGAHHHFGHSETDPFSIPNNSVWSFFEDSHRNIWIGTFSGGLCMVDMEETEVFRTYTSQRDGLSHNMVSAFAEMERTVWIGTEGGGLNVFDRNTRTFIRNGRAHEGGLSSYNIKTLAFGPDGDLWIGMFRGGLNRFTNDGKTVRYSERGHDPTSVHTNNLRKIVREGDRGLWIIYQMKNSLVSYCSFDTEEFSHYYFDNKDNGYYLLDIVRGRDHDLWLLSSKNLYRFNTAKNTAQNVLADTLSYVNGQSLCIDGKGHIWIGTTGHGLIRYEPESGRLEILEKILDLNISAIYSIIADDDDNIWMGTDNGLVLYDTDDRNFYRFDETDGLQGQVYYPLACMKAADGVLFFGGTNGFTAVNPGNIRRNPQPPNIIISEFLLDNGPARPAFRNDGWYDTDEIVLPYNQTNFGFRFSSDNFMIPEKSSYRYRLHGYDNRWITADASNRNAVFTKVPAGTYRFDIQAANNDGVWGPVFSVRITRRSAPWAGTAAYILYAAIVATVATVIIRFYRQRKMLEVQLYKDHLEQQQKEEIHQSQLRFFTNISHDFRTPLSLIQGVVDNLREKLPDNYYRILHSNTHRLLNLINELMDFRTIEHGKMQLQVSRLDLNRLAGDIASDFDELARRRKLNFKKVPDHAMPERIYADRLVLEKIIMNLLNNAFKYTPVGGTISIETYSQSEKFRSEHQTCFTVGDAGLAGFTIAVRDSGVGISAATIHTVFERYYNVKTANLDAHLGTGIGLALVKSLVLLHKGSITIYSTRDKGTDMVVVLPSDPMVYSTHEFSSEHAQDSYVAGSISDKFAENVIRDISGDETRHFLLRERKRILVVEDNNDLRKLMSDYLSSHYDIEEVSNGWVASRYLADHEVNMIISDIMMPVKDGITLCREVKENVDTSHIPFLMPTAKTGLGARIEGAESGADVYFEKPIDLNLLLITVRNIFERQDRLRDHYSKNYFVDSAELAANETDNTFLKKLVDIIDNNLNKPVIDVHLIASGMSMSRTRLYSKLKSLTGKSIVEFILNYRLRKAAKLMIEQDLSMKEVMDRIGIRSQSYFTNAFKKEFGDTPAAFARKHNRSKKRMSPDAGE